MGISSVEANVTALGIVTTAVGILVVIAIARGLGHPSPRAFPPWEFRFCRPPVLMAAPFLVYLSVALAQDLATPVVYIAAGLVIAAQILYLGKTIVAALGMVPWNDVLGRICRHGGGTMPVDGPELLGVHNNGSGESTGTCSRPQALPVEVKRGIVGREPVRVAPIPRIRITTTSRRYERHGQHGH